jgi:hypothetical protein
MKLREELHEQTLTHERKLLSEAQEQQRRCIAEKNEDHDYLQNQLKYKMAENTYEESKDQICCGLYLRFCLIYISIISSDSRLNL